MADVLGFLGDVWDITFTVGTASISLGLLMIAGAVIALALRVVKKFVGR